jgi:hypothetical protein
MIEIINKEYFAEYNLNMNKEEKIKSIEKEIDYIKCLINETNSEIKNLKNNCYLTYEDIISNDPTKNILLIKAKDNISPNIQIIAESDEINADNNDQNFDTNFNFNITNNLNNWQNEYINKAYDAWNITEQSSPFIIDKIKNDNPIELFLISPKLVKNN